MTIHHIHTYLVHPRKGEDDPPQITGTTLTRSGRLFDLLKSVYVRSDEECDIDITFAPAPTGDQQNDCRDLICRYLSRPSLATGRRIARRLESHTDGRSGLGLLFLIVGIENEEHKIVLSRFPTDNAIYVDEHPGNLTVQFLERVFMKNKASYKAVAYRHSSIEAGFWSGRAIDKQLNNLGGEQSNYWILDFLMSQFTLTAAAGTRRLALALRNAATTSDLAVKQELTAAATLAPGLAGQRLTIEEIGQRFGLSEEAKAAIRHELKAPALAQERFEFDLAEFQSLIAFKAIELSNGGTLTAPAPVFDRVFRKEQVHGQQVRYTTEGTVVNERLKSKV